MEIAGAISSLACHPKFQIDNPTDGSKPVFYVADFQYLDEKGQMVIEDVKGSKNQIKHDPYSALKIRLAEQRNDVKVTIVVEN